MSQKLRYSKKQFSWIPRPGPNPPPNIGDTFRLEATGGVTVQIDGLGTATLQQPALVFSVQGYAPYTPGYYGTLRDVLSLNTRGEWEKVIDIIGDFISDGRPYDTYDLSTPAGPASGVPGDSQVGSGPFLTSAGEFQLVSWSTAYFEAALVPETDGIGILVSGLLSFLGKRRPSGSRINP